MAQDPRLSTRLQSLELQGYKTFAAKTRFEFAPTITAIVGPNGSGKSNIADAIRWVLGEQSYSLLRGKKTEDMIFAGSDSRPRAGLAAATITFDNSDEWLPIEFTQVSVGRRASRDGQNEYLINDQRVRLRDVGELLAASGLAERTYTMIGQGVVDAALSLRAEERRQLFEEAAGIGLYRSRREESVRRLESTRRNLERVQDILSELRPRLRSLERQAQRARDYEQVKQDLKASLRQWYGFHWNRVQSAVASTRRTANQRAAERERLARNQTAVTKELNELRAEIGQLRQQLQAWTSEAGELYRQREESGRQIAVIEERQRWLEEQAEFIASERDTVTAEIQRLEQALQGSQSEVARFQSEIQAIDLDDTSGTDEKPQTPDRAALAAKQHELQAALEQAAAKQAAWETRAERLAIDRARAGEALNRARQLQSQAEAEDRQARSAHSQAQAELDELQPALDELTEQLAVAESELAQRGQALSQAQERSAAAGVDAARAQARLHMDAEHQRRSDAGSRRLLQAGERGDLAGVVGRVAELLDIPEALRRAIVAALGARLHAVAVTDEKAVAAALSQLESNEGPRPTALTPLSGRKPPAPLKPPSNAGVLGNAAEMVGAAPEVEQLVRDWLGSVWVVRDLTAASSLRPTEATLVTLAGEVLHPEGTVVLRPLASEAGGISEAEVDSAQAASEAAQAALAEQRAMEAEAKAAVDRLRRDVEAARQRVAAAKSAEAEAASLARTAQAKLRAAVERLDEQTAALQAVEDEHQSHLDQGEAFDEARGQLARQLSDIRRALEAAALGAVGEAAVVSWESARRGLDDAQARLQERERRLERLRQEAASWQRRLDNNKQEQAAKSEELSRLKRASDAIQSELDASSGRSRPAEQSLQSAEARRSELEQQESELRRTQQEAENQHSQAQIELARREEELTGLQRRIEDDFGLVAYEYDEETTGQEPLPLHGLVERLPRVSELPEGLETQVKRLRAQLRRMGSINPESVREYRSVKERVAFMTEQVDDLRAAETQLEEVIAELDVIMARAFRTTFDEVAAAFKETFQRLFGGGSARLLLTDPDDPNESGIEIETRLPGKREQGLAVLSGGERSLTASALVFALLRVSPTPFCVLDEVDAMLDEANVGRFCQLLQELSRETQFIVITHNRQTVQVAQAVYGVSMAPDSTSQIVSLDLEEAAREIAA